MDQAYQDLLELRKITEEVNGLLYRDDLESVFGKLSCREKLMKKLNPENLQSLIANEKESNSKYEDGRQVSDIKSIIKSISVLDNKNMEVINSKINKISYSLAELAKEKKTVKDLRAISKMGHKQIIDFLY